GVWYVALLIASALRLLIQRSYLIAYAENSTPKSMERHSALILIGIVLYGTVWCLPSTWLFLVDPAKQVMMTVFLVGLSAAGIGSLAPMRHAYLSFIVPFM